MPSNSVVIGEVNESEKSILSQLRDYKKLNIDYSSSVLTTGSYNTILEYKGEGRLVSLYAHWANLASGSLDMAIKLTLDGVVTWWTLGQDSSGATEPKIVLTHKNSITSSYNNNNYLMFYDNKKWVVQDGRSEMDFNDDGTADTGVNFSSALYNFCVYDEPLYFKESLKVEVYINGAGSYNTNTTIAYMTKE